MPSIRAERPTMAAAVPTIWQAILQYGQTTDIDLSSLRMGTSGGAAAPRSLLQLLPGPATACGSSRAGG